MTTSSTIPATSRLIAWSRSALVTLAFLLFAGIMTKLLASGSTPFGWSDHWSEHEGFGLLLHALASTLWIPALLGRVGPRVIVATVLVALSFPAGDETISLIRALMLVALPLWIGLRTLDQVRTASGSQAPAPAG